MLETNPSCPTGNCTYPMFSSLAFCSNCIDIAQFLQQNSHCDQDSWAKSSFDDSIINYWVNCTYWFPLSSSGLNYSYDDPDFGGIHAGSYFNREWEFSEERKNSSDAKTNRSYSYWYAPAFLTQFLYALEGDSTDQGEIRLSSGEVIPNSFATIALIKMAPRTGSANNGFVDTAHICALSVCAKEYNISMTSGLLQSEVISTSYSKRTRHYSDRTNVGNSSYTFAFSNNDHNFTFIVNGPIKNFGTTFEHRMTNILQQTLEGALFLNSDLSEDPTALRKKQNIFQIALNASTDIPKVMDRVAEAMTNRLRDISNHTVQGQSGIMELYIQISWWWLLLPGSCIFLGTVYLVWVMIMTRKRQLPIWKASELTLLFHGFDFPIGDSVDVQKTSEMEKIASALRVRLGRDSKNNKVLKLERKLE